MATLVRKILTADDSASPIAEQASSALTFIESFILKFNCAIISSIVCLTILLSLLLMKNSKIVLIKEIMHRKAISVPLPYAEMVIL